MTITSIEQAMQNLHRLHWFVLGFAAARPPERDETAGQHLRFGAVADGVSGWLAGILDRKRRTIAPAEDQSSDSAGSKTRVIRNDGGLLVVSFAELERIGDGLMRSSDGGDRDIARATVQTILREFQAEQADYNDEIPF